MSSLVKPEHRGTALNHMNNAESILKVNNLTKRFGDVVAVDGLSFEVDRGEIFGFLGPNGAGKTTAINMISGLLKPDAGSVEICGISAGTRADVCKNAIGICPQDIVVWEGLTCMEQLEFMGQMYDMDERASRKKSLELLEAMGLADKKDKQAKTLSGGMKRRLNIILALVHSPEMLILDEPQAGLDPQSRVLVRDYIRSISKKMTIILTTHDMDEAERLSDRVAIIDRGRLLVLDTPDRLKSSLGAGEILEFSVKGDKGDALDGKIIAYSLLDRLEDKGVSAEYSDGIYKVAASDLIEQVPKVLDFMKQKCMGLENMRIRKKTLEDVFIALTGRGLRE